MACGILVPGPGIEPGPSTVRAPSPNHWTAREVPGLSFFICKMGVTIIFTPYLNIYININICQYNQKSIWYTKMFYILG